MSDNFCNFYYLDKSWNYNNLSIKWSHKRIKVSKLE